MKAKNIMLPIKIGAEKIALATGGAEITQMKQYQAGESDPRATFPPASFPVDTTVYTGVIYPADEKAPAINFEVGFPEEWNGKLIHQGGSGIDGFIPPVSATLNGQEKPLGQGFGVFCSDSGHQVENGNFYDCKWLQNTESCKNFAHEQLKKTHDAVCAFAEILYGVKAERVYFYGGSNGGRECMKAIQEYPEDYDGAVCFFPVLYWYLKVWKDTCASHHLAKLGMNGVADPAQSLALAETVLKVCDELDGLKDDVISCPWKAEEMAADVKKAIKEKATPEQFEMYEDFAAAAKSEVALAYDNELPGYEPFLGSEMFIQYAMMDLTQNSGYTSLSDALLANVVAFDEKYDMLSFAPEDFKDRILEVSRMMDACKSDLDAYRAAGGKLILVQGLTDPLVAPKGTIRYYERLKERYGADALEQFVRFYIVPGYAHGDGKFVPEHNFLEDLEKWVDEGVRLETLTAADVNAASAGRKRPLYPYPGVAVYNGTGDPDKAENFHREDWENPVSI